MRSENLSRALGEIRSESRSESRISSNDENNQSESIGMEVGYDEPSEVRDNVDVGSVPIDSSYSQREVIIKPLNSGFLINVGCQSAAIETNEQLIKTLTAYFENPYKFEKEWFKNNNRSKL